MSTPARAHRRQTTRAPRGADGDANRLGWALFPLRLFLGLTFVYGGIQKLGDPGFLQPGAPTYIGTQLRGFAHGTPGGFLLQAFAIPHPRLSGVGVALAEIAIGLLVTAGVATRLAAAAGLALNLVLFLTNSWATYPFFLGSDIVFVFAWLPFVLVGERRQPALAPRLRLLALTRMRERSVRDSTPSRRTPGDSPVEPELTRRGLIGTGLAVFGSATAAIAGVSFLTRGTYGMPRTLGASTSRSRVRPTQASPPPQHAAAKTPHRAPALPSGAAKLGPANRLPPGQAATYRDPGDGQPDIVIRQANGALVAHRAVCTHAGCTVGYQGGQIVCPCHGAVFDARTGAVVSGPAPAPLAPRKVLERAGQIYAVPG